jgi:hypothetical protein
MSRLVGNILLCLLLAAGAARGELRKVPDFNFAIEVPQWWMNTAPAPTGSVLAVQSPRKDRSLVVIASPVPPSAVATAQADTVYGMKKAFTGQEYRVGDEIRVESQGLTWTTFTATLGNVDTVIWVYANERQAYLVRADNTAGGKLADDPEVQAALRSFRLLGPVEQKITNARTSVDTSEEADLWAFWLGIGVGLVLVVVAVWLVIPSDDRKRRRHSH